MVVVCQGCDGRFSDENHLQQHIYSDSNYACLLAYSKENQPQQKRSSRSKSVPVPSKRKRTIIEIAEQALNFSTEGDQRRARNDDQLESASSSPSSSKVSTAGIASQAIERLAPPVPTAANRTAIEYAGTARFCEFKAYIDNATIHHIGLTPSQTAAVQVMSIMDRKGGSIALYNEVMEWHASHSGGKHKTVHADKLYKELLERYHLRNVLPQVVPVHLESIGSTVPLVVHDFTSQLIDLLSDPRIKQEDYLFPGGFPGGKIPETQEILGDIITGESYRATYKELIEPEPMTACGRQKVLLPMLLYMDGCATGQTMNGEVEILKFTIGILKLSARRNWWAWRELGLTTKPLKGRGLAKQMMTDSDHLDAANYLSSCSNSDKYGGGPLKEGYDPTGCIGFGVDVGIDNREDGEVNSQDLHRMLHIMMESYKVLEGGFPWDMPWDGSIKRLLLVPYIELACLDGKAGDQFAQTYLTKTGVQCLCRICVCPTEWSDEAYREDDAYKTVPMIQKLVQDRNRAGLKTISQQCCQNFSWGLKFGSHNNRGIYGASSPPDTLHQLQLNLFGNTRDNFFEQIGASSALGKEINALVTLVGEYMKRQSDRDLPRTSFSRDAQSGVLMGHEMVGLLLVISGAIRTTAGRAKILNMSHGKARELFRVDDGTHIDRWSTYLDTLLEYEAFLKQPKMKASSVERMKTKIRELMNMIVKVGRRSKGMGCNTATHHTAKHLPQAILDHGVPENFNVFDMERHHRPDKKTAQRTQKHPETFNCQMAVKKIHRRAIELAMEETNGNKRWHYLLPQTEKETKLPGAKSTVELTGVSVRVSLDNEGSVVQVVGECPNKKQYKHSESVLSAVGGILMECAEHLKALKVHDCIKLHNGPEDSQIYRASPLCQGKPWYDWAMFDLRGPSEEDWNSKTRVPCQIRCFVDMRCLSLLAAQETQYKPCVYAVVEPTAPDENILEQRRSAIWKPHVKKAHSLVPNENQTLILPVSRIVEPAALIPDHGNLNKRAYLRLTRRKYWAELFENWLDEEHTRSWDDSDEEFEEADADESDIEISAALDKPGDISADELADILEMSEECRRDIRAENVSDVCSPVTRSMNAGSRSTTTSGRRRRTGRTAAGRTGANRRTGAR